ncbi:MAG: U32 family peptidase [Fibrobacterota bacterium]|nr:U32 family peptidase [Fibrobacterota bacterium]
MPNRDRRPEVLAPVGDMDMCMAAVHNGADAIYVGFPGFNARGRTIDHTWESLDIMIAFCHKHDVKVFLALNVLIFEKELRQLLSELPRALSAGVDAFIVQDLGLALLMRFFSPTQAIHASTQMTVTNHESIVLTEDLGLARYVLGREVSLKEMALIRSNTDKELEVFVHGALCVSYSGQCLTSEGFGGRSANRGQCAQSCRMEYDLMVDGERRDLGDRRYLVSPKDLCGLDDVPALMELGIDSFKIEGRLKTPQYVASTSSAYRKAIEGGMPDKAAMDDLQITYSRGFFNGWMDGVDHQRLVDGRYGSHRGLEIGTVASRGNGSLRIGSKHPLQAGDGLLFVEYLTEGVAGLRTERSWGGRIFSAEPVSDGWYVSFSNDFRAEDVPLGAVAYLNDSPSLEREIRRSFADKSRWKTLPLDVRMEGKAGSPLRVTVSDGAGRTAFGESAVPLQSANNPATAMTRKRAEKEAGGLSGSGYHLRDFAFAVASGLFLADKEVRKARQAAVAGMQSLRDGRAPASVRSSQDALVWMETAALDALKPSAPVGFEAESTPTRLNLLVRERSTLESLAGLPLHTVYLDFEHGKDYKGAVEIIRGLGFRAGIATTRILKPSEYHNLKVIEAIAPDAVLVRNLGALQYLAGKGMTLEGDFSLNVSNSLTAAYLTGKGLASLCPSYDLNQWQLFDLIEAMAAADAGAVRRLEITVHQYLPSFHMEHCVFAAFLSEGSSFKDCGKPCEKHRVELRDHTGALHPLKADQECRNTMFNGKPQSAAMLVPSLLAKGVRRFRIEALYEDAKTLRTKIEAYAGLVAGAATPQEVFSRMGVVEKYGVMEGQLRNSAVHKDRKKA